MLVEIQDKVLSCVVIDIVEGAVLNSAVDEGGLNIFFRISVHLLRPLWNDVKAHRDNIITKMGHKFGIKMVVNWHFHGDAIILNKDGSKVMGGFNALLDL